MPALSSTLTLNPFLHSVDTTAGVKPTLRSPEKKIVKIQYFSKCARFDRRATGNCKQTLTGLLALNSYTCEWFLGYTNCQFAVRNPHCRFSCLGIFESPPGSPQKPSQSQSWTSGRLNSHTGASCVEDKAGTAQFECGCHTRKLQLWNIWLGLTGSSNSPCQSYIITWHVLK